MGKGKTAEKIILILLLLALGFFGGTARQRTDALAPASSVPTPQTERQTPAPPAPKTPKETVAVPEVTLPPETTAPTPTPTPEPERYVFHFVGDCTLASDAYHQGGPDGYDTVINGDFS